MNKKIRFFMENFLEILCSVPKTIYFNFKLLPFSYAIKLPFMVSYHIKLKGINRSNFIIKKKKMGFASQRIGFGGSLVGYGVSKKGIISIKNNGKIVFEGDVGLSRGLTIDNDGGTITFGDNFRMNYSCVISCDHAPITIGKGTVLGWNVTIKNGDGHSVIYDGEKKPQYAEIEIGEHVWLCSCCTVLKGTHIGNDSVVAYQSLVTKAENENGVLYAGVPAKIIRRNITWEE